MNILLIILITIIVTAGLAFLIVKFVPLKLKWIISILLLVLSIFLIVKIYQGVMNPIKFKEEKEIRYAKVIKQLKLIRDAEEKYKQANGTYSNNEAALQTFIKEGKLALTETKNIEKTIKLGGGITKKISVKQVDTVGYEKVSRYFKGKNISNLFSVPGTKEKFDVQIATIEKIKGLYVPVFQAKIHKKYILVGMDKNETKQELIVRQTSEVKGDHVSVGSLEEVTLGGNWPPSYDKKETKSDKK